MNQWKGVVLNGGGCVLSVDLNTNNLQGTIPASIGTLSNLEALGLGGNGIGGIIPDQIGDLSKLHTLELSGDQLQGVIPDGLRNLTNLTFINLGANQLTGTIPDWIGELVNLEFISLGTNQLTGEIPSSIGKLQRLKRVLLHNNQLVGEIPTSLGGLSNLEVIQLDNNQLSGCFGESLRPLCSVMYDFTNNPKLPWQGDFSRFCAGESQSGAICDDNDPNTINDQIQSNCSCQGKQNGAPKVELQMGCGTVEAGQTICIPVSISAVDSLFAAEFTVGYNQLAFEFESLQNIHPAFDQPLTINPVQSQGRIKVLWLTSDLLSGSKFNEGDVLFEFCLRAKNPGVYPADFITGGENFFMAYGSKAKAIIPSSTGCPNIQVTPASSLDAFFQACYSLNQMQGTTIIVAYGGIAPYNISWAGPQPGLGTINNSGDTLRIQGLPQGTYTFHIRDQAGGDSIKIIDLPNPGLGIDLALNTVPRNPTCFGSLDGTLRVNPTGGTTPYFIKWSTGDINTRCWII
ncbi:MAG: cohesin domain-containing protein [Saprospiraceae bacterium]